MSFQKFISWHKSFSKEGFVEEKIECFCKDTNGFYITKRQASAGSSVIIFLATLLFAIGYLLGQRKAIQEFTSKVVNDSFADQVNYSMYSLYGDNSNIEQEVEQPDNFHNSIDLKNTTESILKNDAVTSQANLPTTVEPSEGAKSKVENDIKTDNSSSEIKSDVKHFAILIGFGSKKFAEQFVNKVEKIGYTVYIMPRKSKTSKGKEVNWYQIITDSFDDKSKLIDVTNKIKASQRLNDIQYMTVK